MEKLGENSEQENLKQPKSEHIITRHSIKTDSPELESKEYSGLTEEGVELARERAGDIYADIISSNPGTVFWFGGVSDEIRTRSTIRVYADEISRKIKGKDGEIKILNEDEIKLGSISASVNNIRNIAAINPESKIIVVFPLFIKNFGRRGGLFDKEGNAKEYTKSLTERSKSNEDEFLKTWFDDAEQDAINDKTLSPEEESNRFLAGINRMENFARGIIGEDRDLKIIDVGHSPQLEAFLADSIAERKGISAREAYNTVVQKRLSETETIKIKKINDQDFELDFRGEKFSKN